MVIHAVDYSRKDGVFATSELSFYLGKNFLVTFHSKPLRPVELAGEMCLRNTADIATEPGRVAYTLLDLIVENYKPALDELAMEVAEVEQKALTDPGKETLNTILQIKKEVLQVRQIIGPQKEVLSRFVRGEFKLIQSHLIPYYRDVYDGLYNIGELAARYAESLTGVLQVYLNMSSNKTGEIVKLLTVFTVITTPMNPPCNSYRRANCRLPDLSTIHVLVHGNFSCSLCLLIKLKTGFISYDLRGATVHQPMRLQTQASKDHRE